MALSQPKWHFIIYKTINLLYLNNQETDCFFNGGIMTQALYILSIAGLIASALKSKQKTKKVLMKAYKSFMIILPQMLGIMMIVEKVRN